MNDIIEKIAQIHGESHTRLFSTKPSNRITNVLYMINNRISNSNEVLKDGDEIKVILALGGG